MASNNPTAIAKAESPESVPEENAEKNRGSGWFSSAESTAIFMGNGYARANISEIKFKAEMTNRCGHQRRDSMKLLRMTDDRFKKFTAPLVRIRQLQHTI